MAKLYRVGKDLIMSPITGIRPIDDRWGGEIPEEYVEAIYEDVVNQDLPNMLAETDTDFNTEDIISMAVLQTIIRTSQRLAVELDGCHIDTTTIFDDEKYGDEDEADD